MLKLDRTQLTEPTPDTGSVYHVYELLEAWEQAKTAELTANEERLRIESQLVVLLSAPEEGQKSHRAGDFRVTRTNKISYKGDVLKVVELSKVLELTPPIKAVIDETKVKHLRRERPTDFELLVAEGALSMSPAKPQFEVTRVATAKSESLCRTVTS